MRRLLFCDCGPVEGGKGWSREGQKYRLGLASRGRSPLSLPHPQTWNHRTDIQLAVLPDVVVTRPGSDPAPASFRRSGFHGSSQNGPYLSSTRSLAPRAEAHRNTTRSLPDRPCGVRCRLPAPVTQESGVYSQQFSQQSVHLLCRICAFPHRTHGGKGKLPANKWTVYWGLRLTPGEVGQRTGPHGWREC